MMRVLAAVALAGCFSPSPKDGFTCGPNGWCPDPLHCAGDGTCRRTETVGDGGSFDVGDGDTTAANWAFVTDVAMTPVAVGGPTSGDAMCTRLAHDAGLAGNYVAWISLGTTAIPAFMRLGSARGWVRRDGEPFADTVWDLIGGVIFNPLRLDQHGNDVGATLVMTATNPNGIGSGQDCMMWSSTSSALPITVGVTDGTRAQWSEIPATGSCDQSYRVYCLEIDHVFSVAPVPKMGPLAFVSASLFTPGGGLTAADALCQSDAMAQNKSGTFLAALATTTASAGSRFTLPAVPWVRVDGVPTTKDFVNWQAPINQIPRGDYITDQAFSGANGPLAMSAMDGSENCTDWHASNGTSRLGEVARAGPEAFGGAGPGGCTPHRILCLEQ